jgi:predicted porin
MNKSRVCWVLPIVLASTGAAWAADTEIRVYGGVDVSVDYFDNGLKSLPAISSNNSYVGFGGSTTLGPDWSAVAQIEGQADVSATPSVRDTFGFRNSFVGFVSKEWGSIKAGKNDTPYKSSTAAWDPFANTIGDYNSIFSNTGGDSRVEFEVRAPHAIWYESPKLGPFQLNLMWSPGQNLAGDNSDFPLGDNTCSGGTFGSSGSGNAGTQNNFGSTGNSTAAAAGQAGGVNTPHTATGTGTAGGNTGFATNVFGSSTIGSGFGECTDGAFGDLYSTSVIFKQGNFIAIAAGELHHAVNRLSDVVPVSGRPIDTTGAGTGDLVTTRNEWAAKVGAGYDFGVVKVFAAYEFMRRTNTPDAFNERSRDGVYASVTWRATEKDDISFSYNHAFATPGNPAVNSTVNFLATTPLNGQVCPQTNDPTGLSNASAHNDDAADQYSVGIRHYFSPAVSVYAVGSYMHNHPCGHFTLGAGGHGIVAAQRNQFNETFPGKDLAGVSVGTTFRF